MHVRIYKRRGGVIKDSVIQGIECAHSFANSQYLLSLLVLQVAKGGRAVKAYIGCFAEMMDREQIKFEGR